MTLRVTPQDLAALQRTTDRIRNICILAHVDHGKTTLSDSLVSANGIISDKLAGKIRYLDNTEEEQTRGITMKSSAISLLFMNEPTATANATEGDADAVPYLINLVDSPGHVDFSFDVSTAVRLCDGALVLIDAVEGVCAQTIAVIRQAWQEGIRPCLIINKMDRLIFELQLSPYEACERLNRIMEQANAVLSALIRAEVLAKYDEDEEEDEGADAQDETKKGEKESKQSDHEAMANEVTALENELLFSPVNGNVLFASAADGWAFNIGFFAHLYSKKLELPFRVVRQALWGDHYYNAKTKKIVTKAPTANSQTMFCSFILDPIWKTYNTLSAPVSSDADLEALRKLTKQLRVAKVVTDRDLKHGDRKVAIQAVMRKWLPLANTVLKMVTRALPNPIVAQQKRAAKLCGFAETAGKDLVVPAPQQNVYSSMEKCETLEASPVVVFICKIISVEANVLSDFRQQGLNGDDAVYVAMGRVYSGVLRAGAPVYVLDPKFQGLPDGFESDASEEEIMKHVKHVSRLPEGQLRTYMLMGRELHALSEVPAGNIVGIIGLQDSVLKTATLSSTIRCPSLTRMPYQAKPIVRVAVEPEDPRNFAALEAGLQRLYRSDPTVEVQVQETGEHVVVALGELHLERCIKDLKERFAKVAIRVSEPLVGFRESVADDTTVTPSPQQGVVFRELLATSQQHEDPKVAWNTTPDGSLSLKVRALPLPKGLAKFLEEHVEELRVLVESRKTHTSEEASDDAVGEEDVDSASGEEDTVAVATAVAASTALSFGHRLEELLRASENDTFWKTLPLERVWSFGPRRVGPNMLVNNMPDFTTSSPLFGSPMAAAEDKSTHELVRKLESSIVTGFQMATSAGPLCDEPVWGVAFVVDSVVHNDRQEVEDAETPAAETEADAATTTTTTGYKFGPISGQVMSTMRTACRVAFIKQPVRLVEAVYECTVQCLAEQLGKLYSVIAKRRGDVFSEELSDGSALFTIQAHVPVVESFGFATDLLIQTSGAASNPQLVFSHWAVLTMDPYFQPQTEEEREDWGERVYDHNVVRKYIEAVRKRKGLARDEKIVVHAEKQRTLARKR